MMRALLRLIRMNSTLTRLSSQSLTIRNALVQKDVLTLTKNGKMKRIFSLQEISQKKGVKLTENSQKGVQCSRNSRGKSPDNDRAFM